jgi:5-formyltetrahydrofolate cyclo-ligase|tara:strand:- start:1532 stop:1678 length:147 start_codon:yes stop_codon:yes gene_type:complete
MDLDQIKENKKSCALKKRSRAHCLKPLPRNSYDQSLDWVITEQKIKEF